MALKARQSKIHMLSRNTSKTRRFHENDELETVGWRWPESAIERDANGRFIEVPRVVSNGGQDGE